MSFGRKSVLDRLSFDLCSVTPTAAAERFATHFDPSNPLSSRGLSHRRAKKNSNYADLETGACAQLRAILLVDGVEHDVPAEEVQVGDLIVQRPHADPSYSIVCCDARILWCEGFRVVYTTDRQTFRGLLMCEPIPLEADFVSRMGLLPHEKTHEPCRESNFTSPNIVFAGGRTIGGVAVCVVTAVGENTLVYQSVTESRKVVTMNSIRENAEHSVAVDCESVLQAFQTSLTQGLTTLQVSDRLAEHGYNRLPEIHRLQGWTIKYKKSERHLEDLLMSVQRMCFVSRVLRDEQWGYVGNVDLVPGDVVGIVPGDIAECDMRVLRIFTPLITKQKGALTVEPCSVPLGDANNVVLAGDTVLQGRGIGVVVATGSATQWAVAKLYNDYSTTPPTSPRLSSAVNVEGNPEDNNSSTNDVLKKVRTVFEKIGVVISTNRIPKQPTHFVVDVTAFIDKHPAEIVEGVRRLRSIAPLVVLVPPSYSDKQSVIDLMIAMRLPTRICQWPGDSKKISFQQTWAIEITDVMGGLRVLEYYRSSLEKTYLVFIGGRSVDLVAVATECDYSITTCTTPVLRTACDAIISSDKTVACVPDFIQFVTTEQGLSKCQFM